MVIWEHLCSNLVLQQVNVNNHSRNLLQFTKESKIGIILWFGCLSGYVGSLGGDFMILDPVDGGCWFCRTDDWGEWWFSAEFDCYAHEKCIRQSAKEGDIEATIMMKEFEMEE